MLCHNATAQRKTTTRDMSYFAAQPADPSSPTAIGSYRFFVRYKPTSSMARNGHGAE